MDITYDSWMDIVAAILLVLGTLLSAVAGFGLLRFPDVLSRMHAATKPQVLGLLLALAGMGFALRTWTVVPVLGAPVRGSPFETTFTHSASLSLKYEVSVDLRRASRLFS